jgi:hypothetical protein
MTNWFSCQNHSWIKRNFGKIALVFCMLSSSLQAQPISSDGRAQAVLQAFQQAEDLPSRFELARQMAAIRYDQGRLMAAQWWLRRAANYAPDRTRADENRADFQKIRGQARFRPSLSFNARPSSNINNGAEDRILSLGNIILVFPSSALALSGIEYTGRATLEWRLSESARQRSFVDLDFYGRTYSLSPDAKRLAPRARGRDYALTQLAVGVSHLRQLHPDLGPTRLRFSIGQVRSGGQDLRSFRRLDLGQSFRLSQRTEALVSAYVENQIPLRSDQPRAVLRGLRGETLMRLQGGDSLRVSLDHQNYDASIRTSSFRESQLHVTYALAKPILTVGVSVFGAASRKRYDEFSLSLDGRRDQRFEIGATFVFNEATFLGFSPNLTVSAHRTSSNVDLFDSRGASVSMGFQSRF